MLNHHLETPSLALVAENVDPVAFFKKAGGRMRRWLRKRLCFALNGGHELYRAHTDTKLYQQCLLCGYETAGWTIDRRDRRLHIVGPATTAVSR